MPVWVKLLRLILVGVHTKLVVMSRFILPLVLGLDTEQFHEGFNFDIVVLFAELLSGFEEPVTRLSWRYSFLRRPLFLFTSLLAIVAIICLSFILAFLIFVSIFIIAAALRSIVLLLFLLNIGVAIIKESLHGGAGAIDFGLLHGFNGSQ